MSVVLLTNSYGKEVTQLVQSLVPEGFEFVSLSSNSKEELINKAPMADYFIVSGRLEIDREVIFSATKLKMIQRTGVGIDQIDLNALKESNIPLYINKGVNSKSVAEHTLMLILATSRKVAEADRLLKSGVWKKQSFGIETRSLYGKAVGLIGLGNIGIELVKLLQPFETQIYYNKRNRLDDEMEKKYGLSFTELDDIYRKSDVICLMCSYTQDTHEMIGDNAFKMMKPSSILINTARGKLIDEQALIVALRQNKISGAGLDVHYNEPLEAAHPLTNISKVILTAHTAGITKETFYEMYQRAFNNIVSFEQTKYQEIEHNKYINE